MKIAHSLKMQIDPFVTLPTEVEGVKTLYKYLEACYVPEWEKRRYMVLVRAKLRHSDHYIEKEFAFISSWLSENQNF
tara:strand:- start:407 stop:637 length:231 start_codon:yes stop_codon:yes gene_type:complete